MSFKLLIILCISVLTVQGKNIQDDDDPDTFEVLVDYYNYLEDLVKAAVGNAINTFNQAIKDLAADIANIIADISEQAKKIIEPFNEKINKLEEEAAQLGIDISNCVGNNINVINSLPDQLVDNVSECLQTKYQDAQDAVAELTSEINSTLDIVKYRWSKIKECEQQWVYDQVNCIIDLAVLMTNDSVSIPMTISSLLNRGTEYIASLKTDLSLCSNGKLTGLTQEVTDIVANVTSCSMEKINNYTTSEASTST